MVTQTTKILKLSTLRTVLRFCLYLSKFLYKKKDSLNNQKDIHMARKKTKMTYTYKCSISGKKFLRTRKIANTEELVSVNSYYELNPDKDDRPEKVKKEILLRQEEEQSMDSLLDDPATSEENN